MINYRMSGIRSIAITATTLWAIGCRPTLEPAQPTSASLPAPSALSPQPASEPKDSTAALIDKIRNEQIDWTLVRERFGLLGGEGRLELFPGWDRTFRGPDAETMKLIASRKDDVSFIEQHLLPPLFRALMTQTASLPLI